MQLAAGDGIEHERELLDEPRRAGATSCSILGHAQLIHAIGIETGAGALAVDAARFYFCQVQEQSREHLVGFTDEPARMV